MAARNWVFIALLVIKSFCHSCDAQNTPQEFLAPHNTTRSQLGMGVSPMIWNTTVAAYAQSYANQRAGDCKLIHSGGPYGENLFWGSGSSWNAADAVGAWAVEKQYYNYTTNTCASGHICGHYTQIVWRNSVQLGCARIVCSGNAGVFIICNYNPPGNYAGQKPY